MKYTATGRIGAPVRRASVAGPPGNSRALAEEVDLHSPAADVAIGEQADDLVALERLQRGPAGVGAERHDVHPQLGA